MMKQSKAGTELFTIKNGIFTALTGFVGAALGEAAGKVFGSLNPRPVLITGWSLLAAGDLALIVRGGGFKGSPFAVELERKPAGSGSIEKMDILGLEDASIRWSRYYNIRPGGSGRV